MSHRWISSPGALAGTATLALALVGCDRTRDVAVTGPTTQNGIVIESSELEQISGLDRRCAVKGTLRNDSGSGQRVVVTVNALNGQGSNIGTAVASVEFVAAGARAHYAARFRDFSDDGFLNDCDRIARIEVADIQT
jgi:hypothetical protein